MRSPLKELLWLRMLLSESVMVTDERPAESGVIVTGERLSERIFHNTMAITHK